MEEQKKQPAVFSEPGVVLHDDGTVTQVLSKPVKVTDASPIVNELKYREMLARDLEAVGDAKNQHSAQIKMIAQLTGQTVAGIGLMSAKDYQRSTRIIMALMGNAEPDGGTA